MRLLPLSRGSFRNLLDGFLVRASSFAFCVGDFFDFSFQNERPLDFILIALFQYFVSILSYSIMAIYFPIEQEYKEYQRFHFSKTVLELKFYQVRLEPSCIN